MISSGVFHEWSLPTKLYVNDSLFTYTFTYKIFVVDNVSAMSSLQISLEAF